MHASSIMGTHPTQIARSRREDSYPNTQHYSPQGSSPTVTNVSYGYNQGFPPQYQPPAHQPSTVGRGGWHHVVPSSRLSSASEPLASSFTSSNAPSPATSAHPSTVPWLPPSSPTMPTPTSEHSSSSLNDLTFIHCYPHQAGSASGSDDRGPAAASGASTSVPESSRSRPLPSAYQNSQAPAKDNQPTPAPVDNDPMPRRGRRPVRKSSSEQHLHDQEQQQHQHQLHVQPQRSSRARRQNSAAIAHEGGPIRGIGPTREETSRRKASIASVSSKVDNDSPLLKSGTYQVVCGSASLNVGATSQLIKYPHCLKQPGQSHAAELPAQGAPRLGAPRLHSNVATASSPARVGWSHGVPPRGQPAAPVEVPVGRVRIQPAAAAEVQNQLLGASPVTFTHGVSEDVIQVFEQNAREQVRNEEGSTAESSLTGTAPRHDLSH